MIKFECGCRFPLDENNHPVLTTEYINYDCPRIWEAFHKGLCHGFFQLESSLGKSYSKRLKPENEYHISDLTALLRPGCLNAKDEKGISMTEHYCRRKNGEEPIEANVKVIEDILETTYQVIIFQEQIGKIAARVANFDSNEVETLRKSIGKKKADLLNSCKEKFITRSVQNNVLTIEEATQLWENIEKSNRYAFCKAHAYQYGLLCFETAAIKTHFPLAFYTSWLTFSGVEQDPQEERVKLIEEAKLFGIEVMLPNITKKNINFVNDGQFIYFGLSNIKGIGAATAVKLLAGIEEAENKLGKNVGDFNFLEFMSYVSDCVSSTAFENLIRVGALPYLDSRQAMLHYYNIWGRLTGKREKDCFREKVIQFHNDTKSNYVDILRLVAEEGTSNRRRKEAIFDLIRLIQNPPLSMEDTPHFIIESEEELLGIPISLSRLDGKLDLANCQCADIIHKSVGKSENLFLGLEIIHVREYTTKKGASAGLPMAYITARDNSGILEDIICFAKAYEAYRNLLYKGNIVLVQGRIDKNNMLLIEKVYQG